MRLRLASIGIGLAVAAVVFFLFFPQGCFEDDSTRKDGRLRRGECPQNPSRIGVLWPDGGTGFFGAVLISQLTGWGVGALAWRRLVPPRTRKPGDLRW